MHKGTKGEITMEVKDSLFDKVLGGYGTREDLGDAVSSGSAYLLSQIKIMSDGIKLAQHESGLGLSAADYNDLKEAYEEITTAQFAILKAYRMGLNISRQEAEKGEERE